MSRPRKLAGGDHQVAIGLLVLVGVFGVSLLVFSGIPRALYDTRGETVTAVFRTTAVMAKDTPVRVHGVRVGRVKKTTLNEGGRSATVELAVREEGLPLYKDATAGLDIATVLGGNYVIDIDPGTPSRGELDPLVIPQRQTSTQVEVDEVLEPIRVDEREGLKTMLDELPRAFAENEAPARALGRLADISPQLTRGVGALRGERRDRDLRALVTNTASTVRALDAPADSLTRLVEGGAVTVATTAGREGDIRTTIDRAARVLPEVKTTVDLLDETLGLADPVIARLREPAADVAPTVRALRPTLVGADRLLRDARPLLRSLRPAATSLASAAREGRPLLDELSPVLRRVDRRILPDLAKPDEVTGRPTYQMLGPGVSALHSLAGAFDEVSGLVNLTPSGGERAIDSAPCQVYLTDPTSDELAQCRDIGDAIQDFFSFDPIPPGGAGP